MEENQSKDTSKTEPSKYEDVGGTLSRKTPRIFWYLRYIGMGFIVIAAIFLIQAKVKGSSPILVISNTPLDNESVGELLLLVGIILFGLYLAHRIYIYIRS
jgi:hypothetical protein